MAQIEKHQPHLIVTMGIPGSGKTYFAKHFADSFKAPLISLDNLLGKISVDPKDAEIIFNNLLKELLKTSQTLVLDVDTNTHTKRRQISKLAKSSGYNTLFVWAQVDVETAVKRFIKSSKTKVGRHEFDMLTKRFNKPLPSENIIVISGKHNFATQLKIILQHLAKSEVIR